MAMINWDEKRLGEVAPFKYGKSMTAEKRISGKYDVYSSGGICGLSDEILANKGIIIGRKGSAGSLFYSKSPFFCIDTAFYIDEVTKNNDMLFVYYYMQILNLKSYNNDAAVPGLNRNLAQKLKIVIPKLSNQKRIADILSAYDDLIENNNRRIELLEKAAQDLYKEWFVRFRYPGYKTAKFENRIPVGWKVKKLEEVCQTIGGGTPSTSNQEYWDSGDIMWVTPTDITNNDCIVLTKVEKMITELGLKKSSAKLLPKYTILMTSRATIGYFGLINHEVCTNQGFISVVPNDEYMRMYLLYNLIDRKEEIIAKANGATYKEISKSTFRKFKVIVPAVDILKQFNDCVIENINLIGILKNQKENLIKQRDMLLPRLMSGKLEV